MEFNPKNNIVRLCVQGMEFEKNDNPQAAGNIFLQAWNEATHDFEKFLAAYFVSQHQQDVSEKLKWLETSLEFALKINDDSVYSAIPTLYKNIAKCYEHLGDSEKAKINREIGSSYDEKPKDKGPFFHGTKADLKIGDLLTPGATSNYDPTITMNHIYFTAIINGAGLAAALAKGDGPERVYIVEPTESFENDPNVTDKKFPGNLTRSYRSATPLKIVGEVTDWMKQSSEDIRKWKERLANNTGEIIN
jgi:hypothetical protein